MSDHGASRCPVNSGSHRKLQREGCSSSATGVPAGFMVGDRTRFVWGNYSRVAGAEMHHGRRPNQLQVGPQMLVSLERKWLQTAAAIPEASWPANEVASCGATHDGGELGSERRRNVRRRRGGRTRRKGPRTPQGRRPNMVPMGPPVNMRTEQS